MVLALMLTLSVASVAFAADDGSIKVTNATAGQTYEAYRIFTATPSNPDDVTSNIIYTATAAQIAVSGFSDFFDSIVDSNGAYTISVKNGVTDQQIIDFIKNNYSTLKQAGPLSGTWTNNDTYTFSGLPYGYYYITSSLGSIVTIDTAGKDIAVVDKNESVPEEPDKDITAEDSSVAEALDQTDKELDENNAAVGSVESFQVDFNATNWVKTAADDQTPGSGTAGTKVTEYNFIDTPTGLAIDASTVKVYANWGTSAQADITSTITDIAVDANTGVLTFTIPWVDDASGNHLYKTQTAKSELIPVHITYDATVTDDAATATAPNTVEVKYNNETSLGKSTTTTYTYKFQLKKVDENKAALDGAEFELYYGTSIGENAVPLKFDLVNGVYHYNPNGSVTHIKPTGTTATALIVGLDDASYMLREVVVPGGYNKAADTAVTGLSRVDTADASSTLITIENLKGTELPSTGGIGTTIFYIAGAVLVLGAAAIVIARRKAEQD